jgi:FkbM family methyltransferase
VRLPEFDSRFLPIRRFFVGKIDKFTIAYLGFRVLTRGVSLSRYGSEYGGWVMPSLLARSKGSKILISAGLGRDISFDLELMDQGFFVIGIDPTVESVKYVKEIVGKNPNFELIEACLSVDDSGLYLFPPKIGNHASWSIFNSTSSRGTFFPSISIGRILSSDGVKNSDLKILKMDIEGAEFPILQQLADNPHIFDLCLTELDYISKQPYRRIRTRLKAVIQVRKLLLLMHRNGYLLVATEGYNFTWITPNRLSQLSNFEEIG